MNLPVIWTPEAEATFQAQLDYLEEAWPEITLRKFIDRAFEVIDHLGEHPEMYPVYQARQHIHYCVINPYVTLYYKVKEEQVDLLLFWPSRQDPDKLPL
ncbi:MAG: type II toxin-antitoxin system RelE/ParE family toxin [Cyclobacteriaceae bacterium]